MIFLIHRDRWSSNQMNIFWASFNLSRKNDRF